MSSNELIHRYVESLTWIRDELGGMDDLIDPIMGVSDWDDSVCIDFKGKLVVSADGPYTKRLVLKSALIHASTDVVVKGARPLFAVDCLIGEEEPLREMMASLKRQAEAMDIPILGGNTLFEEKEPRCSITVVGRLLTDEPIRDSQAQKKDVLALLGEPVWGEQKERIRKAGKMFKTWFECLNNVEIHAAKDVTKGGLVSTVHEMQEKSDTRFELDDDLPYPVTRNLDNFLMALAEEDYERMKKKAHQNDCRIEEIGVVK